MGHTRRKIILVPSYFGPHHLIFFGYGSVTVICDCQITEQRREEMENPVRESIAAATALNDKTRLELLKWIA